jgi:aminoglycoside/choline kinase family phosphotransferase
MDSPAHTVAKYLARTGQPDARVVTLTGDASDRRYVRVLPREGEPFVLAVHAGPFSFDSLPFVNVASLFAAMPVPVPRVLGHADDLGILALEDLGDVTLQAHLGVTDAARHRALYRQAVSWIAVVQRRGAELADPRYLPYSIAFDVEKLSWEFDYFVKHFLVAYRGASIDAAAREAIAAERDRLCGELASEPRVLCHRDYHSRNLMLRGDDLVLIDFQDARMGPDTYDLVSLLRDAYVDLGEDQVEALIAYYLALRPADAVVFRARFDVMTVQRALKALGTFGFQAAARGNPVYIQYIPRTLTIVRHALEVQPRFARLRELLAAHLDELR